MEVPNWVQYTEAAWDLAGISTVYGVYGACGVLYRDIPHFAFHHVVKFVILFALNYSDLCFAQ